MKIISRVCLFVVLFLAFSSTSYAVFFDGSGHYGLLGEVQTSPLFADNKSVDRYQVYKQSFSLLGEMRLHDRLSLFSELRFFVRSDSLFLGDHAKPTSCMRDGAIVDDCAGEHQDISFPNYESLLPSVHQLYVRYSFNYCLLEVGRRGRSWGLGMFLDAGEEPFSTQQSVFDGVTCHINADKNQLLSFAIGYDKLAETGVTRVPPAADGETSEQKTSVQSVGATESGDDIHQLFFSIEYDNSDISTSELTRVTGGYFSTAFSSDYDVNVKFFDLYLALHYKGLSARNEFLFRLGSSADPSWHLLGGKTSKANNKVENDVNTIAFAGNLSWLFYRTGSAVDKVQNRTRPLQKHTVFLEYVLAPGDADGYYRDLSSQEEEDPDLRSKMATSNRNTDAVALSLHSNFKPALIFFNSATSSPEKRISGVFDPTSLMNVYLVSLGYYYENFIWGNVELKFITGWLQQEINSTAKSYYKEQEVKPFGYYGRHIGYEVDLQYSYKIVDEVDLSLGAGMAVHGKVWQTNNDDDNLKPNILLQSGVSFNF